MASGDIKILDKLYVNQNVICLALSYAGVVCSKEYNIEYLGYVCAVLFIASAISVMITLTAYTLHYCKKKLNKED